MHVPRRLILDVNQALSGFGTPQLDNLGRMIEVESSETPKEIYPPGIERGAISYVC